MRSLATYFYLTGSLVASRSLPRFEPETTPSPRGPWLDIKTEPTFEAAILKVEAFPEAGVASDDYILTALRDGDGDTIWGPQMFDATGELLFYNDPSHSSMGYQNPHFCSFYANETTPKHLCASFEEEIRPGYRINVPRIYDQSYRQIDPAYNGVGNMISQGHEFHLFPGTGSYISTSCAKKEVGLLPIEGGEKFGDDSWVYDGCFQEVGAYDKTVRFEWCSLDHMSMNESISDLNDIVESDQHFDEADPMPFAQVNSVDKDANGDYLASLRIFSTIVKVAGPESEAPGTILWRLGGKKNDFTFDPPDSTFSTQHHVRYLPSDGGRTLISIFDNSCAAWRTCPETMAKIFEVDEENKVAKLLTRYQHPLTKDKQSTGEVATDIYDPDPFHQGPGGNVELLDNGNVFVGWGKSEVTEFNRETQRPVMHASLGFSGETFAYRTYRGKWNGMPVWRPKMLAYLSSCARIRNGGSNQTDGVDASQLNTYISWNGATEVKSWRISTSRSGIENSFITVGTYPRTGFETHVKLSCDMVDIETHGEYVGRVLHPGCFPGYFMATALDAQGNVLDWGASNPTKVHVPDPHDVAQGVCGDEACEPGHVYSSSVNTVEMCELEGATDTEQVVTVQPPYKPASASSRITRGMPIWFLVPTLLGCIFVVGVVCFKKFTNPKRKGWQVVKLDDLEDVQSSCAVQYGEVMLQHAAVTALKPKKTARPSFARQTTDDVLPLRRSSKATLE